MLDSFEVIFSLLLFANSFACLSNFTVKNRIILSSLFNSISKLAIVSGFVFRTQFLFGLDFYFDFLYNSKNDKQVPKLPRTIWRETAPLGSNSFAVSPDRSDNEDTFLLVNAHQPWDGPIAWYEVHLNSEEGWNMVGGTLPGSPLVFVGHNENLGWAHTINTPDIIDVYELTINPENNSQYLFDNTWRDFEVFDSEINVKILKLLNIGFNKEIKWSIHGPVLELKKDFQSILAVISSNSQQLQKT